MGAGGSDRRPLRVGRHGVQSVQVFPDGGGVRRAQPHPDGGGRAAPPVTREVSGPAVPAKAALIQIGACGVCGTDLHIYLWDDWSQRTIKPGLVIGHEFVQAVI